MKETKKKIVPANKKLELEEFNQHFGFNSTRKSNLSDYIQITKVDTKAEREERVIFHRSQFN